MDWSNKRVVVTGGSGFLGSRIVHFLKKRGIKEIIIPRSSTNDLRVKEQCRKITKNADISRRV